MSTDKTKRRKNLLVDHPAWTERLSEEWDWEKNDELGIKPDEVTAGSHKKAWWIGRGCGHEWEANIGNRVRVGCDCPYCSGRKVLVGFNDLASRCPNLVEEWHPHKNGQLRPEEISVGGGKKVWWHCSKCGHEWQASPNHRTTHNSGCPACAGNILISNKNDLMTQYPDIAHEWHPTKNGDLIPSKVAAASVRKVWWLCPRCGYEYRTRIDHRTVMESGCPVCAGKQVLNGFNDLATTDPEVSAEWNWMRNGDLTPRDITTGSREKVWWHCLKCGHEWQASVRNRTRLKSGCPKCASSHGEKDSASWAVSQGFVVDEQWRHPDCRDKNPLPFDLMLYVPVGNALMEVSAVEYDGVQHSDETTYFNQKNLARGGISYVQRHDAIKTNFCLLSHRVLIRVPHTVTGKEAIGEYISGRLVENGLGWWLDDVDGDAV